MMIYYMKKTYIWYIFDILFCFSNDIGKGVIFVLKQSPQHRPYENKCTTNSTDFDFKPTNTDTIAEHFNKINIKNATGFDNISCNVLKAGAPVLNKRIATLLNNIIKHSHFQTD